MQVVILGRTAGENVTIRFALTKQIDKRRSLMTEQTFTQEQAKKKLADWLKEHHSHVSYYYSIAYYDYTDRPCWAFVVKVLDWNKQKIWIKHGFQVYQDEVKLVY